jgi:hypothetical protein
MLLKGAKIEHPLSNDFFVKKNLKSDAISERPQNRLIAHKFSIYFLSSIFCYFWNKNLHVDFQFKNFPTFY